MNLVDFINAGFVRVAESVKDLIPPPLDTFVEGWRFFKFSQLPDIVSSGTLHAAVSFGPEQPVINGVTFEASTTATSDESVPDNTTGQTGTNWQLRRGNQAPTIPPSGNNITRTEVTAYADLLDRSFGTISGAQLLCKSSIRRNHYVTISGLTVGNRYYFCELYATYPNSLTRSTTIEPSDTGGSAFFAVDGGNFILSQPIRRYGFVATQTSISFLKWGYDANNSYCNAAWCTDEGVA